MWGVSLTNEGGMIAVLWMLLKRRAYPAWLLSNGYKDSWSKDASSNTRGFDNSMIWFADKKRSWESSQWTGSTHIQGTYLGETYNPIVYPSEKSWVGLGLEGKRKHVRVRWSLTRQIELTLASMMSLASTSSQLLLAHGSLWMLQIDIALLDYALYLQWMNERMPSPWGRNDNVNAWWNRHQLELMNIHILQQMISDIITAPIPTNNIRGLVICETEIRDIHYLLSVWRCVCVYKNINKRRESRCENLATGWWIGPETSEE